MPDLRVSLTGEIERSLIVLHPLADVLLLVLHGAALDGQAFVDRCIGLQLPDGVHDSGEAASLMCDKDIDGLAGEIMCVKEGVHGHGKISPPVGEGQIDRAVVGRIVPFRNELVDCVRSEFDVWSRRLIKVDDRTYDYDRGSCPDDLRQFMERFGILSVRVSQDECRVDWLLDGNFRVRVRYVCLLSKRCHRDIDTWTFKLEDESIAPETLLSILKTRQNKYKTWTMISFLSSFVVVCFCRRKVFNRIRQMISDVAWFVVLYIVWSVDIFVVCLAGMSVWITLTEWMKR